VWIKGDGSEGIGVLGIGEGGPNDARVTFYLKKNSWSRCACGGRSSAGPSWATASARIYFTVEPGAKRPASFIVNRLEMVRGIGPSVEDEALKAAGAKAAKEEDVARPAGLARFVAGRDTFATCARSSSEKAGERARGGRLDRAGLGPLGRAARGALARALLGPARGRAQGPVAGVHALPIGVDGPPRPSRSLPAALKRLKPTPW